MSDHTMADALTRVLDMTPAQQEKALEEMRDGTVDGDRAAAMFQSVLDGATSHNALQRALKSVL